MIGDEISISRIALADNPEVKIVIRSVLEEHGITMPGTAYWDASLDEMFEFHSKDRCVYFVAKFENRIIGGAGIYPTAGLAGDTCELVKMYILPEARGMGIGKMLIEKCILFAKENGYENIYLETVPELGKAIGMYEKFGFQHISNRMGNSGHHSCGMFMLKKLD